MEVVAVPEAGLAARLALLPAPLEHALRENTLNTRLLAEKIKRLRMSTPANQVACFVQFSFEEFGMNIDKS